MDSDQMAGVAERQRANGINRCDNESIENEPAENAGNPRECRTFRIDLGTEVAPGVFTYNIPSLGLSGRSRQPLLDGCREIKRILGSTKAAEEHAGLYRSGRTKPDLSCSVLVGAQLTIAEPAAGRIRFSKFQKFDGSAIGRTDTTTATAEAGA